MAEVKVSGVIPAPVGEVWAVAGDFGGIAGWVPALAKSERAPGSTGSQVGDGRSCTIDGDLRLPKIKRPDRTPTTPISTTSLRIRFR